MTASATALAFTKSPEGQIDDLLRRICAELQLDASRYQRAERSYRSVGAWLESQPSIAMLTPSIHPQGSIQLGTTVKPLVGDEYDVDLVCEFAASRSVFQRPVHALDLVERTLQMSSVYRPMIRRKNRCVRLNYEGDFHLDILPACRDVLRGGTCVLVPDRKLQDWTPSNPRGYASWFDGRARRRLRRLLLDKAEPVPNQESVEDKAPLKLCVQLFKRWRDIRHRSNPELAPISIVLTTLAAHAYRGEQSVAFSMDSILMDISELTRTSFPRVVVLNPTNEGEDLSERWNSSPVAYREFVNGINEFSSQWKGLLQTRGIDKVATALERLFGEEIAKTVVEKQGRDVQLARERGEIGMKKSSGIITGMAGSSVIPVPRNATFYGEDS